MKIASAAALARVLGARLAAGGDPYRTVTLSDLLDRVLPYAYVRSALDLAGKAEYDLAVLALLKRPDLIQADPAVVDAVERELELPEPSLGFAQGLEESILRLREGLPSPETRSAFELEPVTEIERAEEPALENSRETAGDADAVAEPTAGTGPDRVAQPAVAAETESAADAESAAADSATDHWAPVDAAAPACWSCDARLPDRHRIRFCPRCGVSQEERRCTGCDERVEDDWHFCARCGSELSA